MKQRAVISTVASIMLAGAMCFGFAACGERETDVGKKIDALTGEEVTEEVWNAAWNKESDAYGNFKVDYVHTMDEREDGDSGYITAIQYIHADNKDYTSFDYVPIIGNSPVGNVVSSYHYYDSAIGEYLEKSEETGNEWVVGTEVSDDVLACYLIDHFASMISDSGTYSDFTYSTEEKGYTLTKREGDSTIGEIKLVVKFAEGKLKAVKCYFTLIELEYNEDDEIVGEKEISYAEELFYITYGGQSVTRPEVSE